MSRLVHVISLDRTPERFEAFRAANPGLAYERVSAADGHRLDRATLIADGVITAANTYTPGALGCALSHIGLWRRCAAGDEPMTIAEDDTRLRADFHEMANALMADLADWDLIKWSWNYDWPVLISVAPGTPSLVVQADQVNTDIDLTAFSNSRGRPALFKLASAAGTGCYSISPRGAQKLLAAALPIGDVPAPYAPKPDVTWRNSGLDVECCRHYPALSAFLALPPLAMAVNRQDLSTIRGHLAVLHDASKANTAVV